MTTNGKKDLTDVKRFLGRRFGKPARKYLQTKS
jgi:hypothetical protein